MLGIHDGLPDFAVKEVEFLPGQQDDLCPLAGRLQPFRNLLLDPRAVEQALPLMRRELERIPLSLEC
jgi:hypothetical protein